MRKASYLALLFIALLGLVGIAKAVATPKSGFNYVKVSSCEQVGKDIKVSLQGGQKYVLTSTIRDAGHGLRNYKLTCISAIKYKVEWTDVVANTTPTSTSVSTTTAGFPIVTSTPSDSIAPWVSLSFGTNLNQTNNSVIKGKTMFVTVSSMDASGIKLMELYQGTEGSSQGALLKKCEENAAAKYPEYWCNYYFSTDNFPVNTVLTFWGKAVDGAGNVNWAGTTKITVKSNDTSVPEIIFSGKNSGTQLSMDVYAVDAKQQSPIVRIEIYQSNSANPDFVWNDDMATSKDVWKHFQEDLVSSAGVTGFIAKAYDKAGNMGVTKMLFLPTNMDHLRVVNPSLSWIYNNILMKNTSIKKNGLKRFYVYTGDTYNKNKMQMVATCTTMLADKDNFVCSYFKPDKLKPSGYGYILAIDNKNKFSSFPVSPFSW